MPKIKVSFTLPAKEIKNEYHIYRVVDIYESFSEACEDAAEFVNFLIHDYDTDVDTDSIKVEMEVIDLKSEV